MMSKADELFEKLDYKKIQDKDICKYVYDKGGLLLTIQFNLKYKTIIISMYDRDEQRKYSPEITMQELKAINKKVQELGWNKDRTEYFKKYYKEVLKPKRKKQPNT